MSLARLPRRVVSLAPPARSRPRRAPAARPLRGALGAPSAALSELRYCPEDDAFVSEDRPASDASALVARARAHYEREGWLVVRGVASAARVADLQAATDALEARAARLTSSRRIEGAWFETQSASGRKGDVAARPGALRKITSPSKLARAFRDLRELALIERVAMELCGLADRGAIGLACAVDQINTKAARIGTGFPWHQDASFLKPRARDAFDRNGGVNVVLALDRSDETNGGFEVLSRTHRTPEPHDARDRYDTRAGTDDARGEGDETASFFDESGRRLEPLDPGDAIFFHPMLAHGSGRNVSGRRRRVATLWYVGKDEEDAP
jgi:ectoine hydroxylase-related dioxygenase (phytanoyl-CoA dioxygenase family)